VPYEQDHAEGYRHSVRCASCHLRTDKYLSAYAAALAWNRRAPSPAALGEGEAELFDANVNRLKACEHIADGDEGWEKLRNECPSTAAVARLRDALTDVREERERLRAVAINLNAAVDAMWNDPHRRASNHWPKHERAISAAQQDLKAALSQAQDRAGKEKA
jgi:hypothetical protein